MSRAVNYIIEHRCEICDKLRDYFAFSLGLLTPIAIPFLIMWMASY